MDVVFRKTICEISVHQCQEKRIDVYQDALHRWMVLLEKQTEKSVSIRTQINTDYT